MNGEEWRNRICMETDTGYSYSLAKRMEKYRTPNRKEITCFFSPYREKHRTFRAPHKAPPPSEGPNYLNCQTSFKA